jgi:type II secretory pathway component PulF
MNDDPKNVPSAAPGDPNTDPARVAPAPILPASFPQDLDPGTNWLFRLSGPLLWTLAGLATVGLVGTASFFGCSPLGAVIGPMILLTLILGIQRTVQRLREQRGMLVLQYVENAVRLNLPLVPFLWAAQRSERGMLSFRLQDVRALLSTGAPVGVSLRNAVPELPPRVCAVVTSGEHIGRLRETLSRALFYERTPSVPESEETILFRRVYPLVIGGFVMLLTTGIAIFVAPKFREIFQDFRTRLPNITVWLWDITDSKWIWFFGVGLMLLLLWRVGESVRKTLVPWWPPLFSRRVTDAIAWRLPWLHSLARDRGLADVCQLLADALRQRVPMPDALGEASTLELNGEFRKQIVRWGHGVSRGLHVSDAAREAGLPDLLTGLLATLRGTATGGPEMPGSPEMLEFLARYYRWRFSRTAMVLRAAAEPAMVLCMGSIVAFVVLALFLPLRELINGVMDWNGRSIL